MKNRITKVKKRNGEIAKFDQEKIAKAIYKAITATGQGDGKESKKVSDRVVSVMNRRFKEGEMPHVEQIQDIVEEMLILEGLVETAKAYILYREQRRRIREAKVLDESTEKIDKYLKELDWQIYENANMTFSLQGLNQYAISDVSKKYWLNRVYPEKIRKAATEEDFHIHDLNSLSTYCCGWDLYDLLKRGFGGVSGKLECRPPKHLRTALGQLVNFFFTVQGECYSEDTQVLTESGWKYFYEVGKEDKVFTLNSENDQIELQEPVKFYKFDYSGPLYNFKSKKLDLLVTPNHNMAVDQYCPKCKGGLYQRKFVKAKDLNPNIHFIPKKGNWRGQEEKTHRIFSLEKTSLNQIKIKELVAAGDNSGAKFTLPEIEINYYRNFGRSYEAVKVEAKKIPMEDWLRFFGFWLAEGSLYKRKRTRKGRTKPYYEYHVRITQNEGKIAGEFEKILKRLPFHYSRKERGGRIEWVISSKQLFSYLEGLKGSGNKFIPEEIKRLDKRLLVILFDWIMKGDGYIDNGNVELSTKSKRLADDFQEITLKLGFSANIYQRTKKQFNWYDVGVSRSAHFRFTKENIRKVSYQGRVYCLEVPNHTLYVRRKGKACWCGNSAGAQAVSNFDTLLAPFIRYDGLSYSQVKQAMQEFLYNCMVPTRTGFQTPFINVTLDINPPSYLADQPVIIGGELQEETYGDFQEEMNMVLRAFYEGLMEGDAKGRPHTFPIPTVSITKDFDWDNPALEPMWKATAKYGVNYFSNFVNSEMDPEDARSMCMSGEEEVVIRNSRNIKRLSIKEIAGKYKEEDFDREGWADCKKEGGLEALSLNPRTLKTEWAKVKRFLRIRGKKGVKIVLEDGKDTLYSEKHPVSVLTRKGLEMKFAKDIRKGDLLLSLKGGDFLSKKRRKIGSLTLNEDLAKILGYFTADGNYLFENRKNMARCGEPRGLQFTFNYNEMGNKELIKSLVKKVFGCKTSEKKDPRYNTYYLYVYKTELARTLWKAGFKKYGRLPQILFNSPKKVIEAFLDFHFKGDGYEKRKEIHINDIDLSRDLVILYSLIGRPVSYKARKNSQRIYIQHKKSKAKKGNGYTNNPTLAERVPGWMASTYAVPGLVKSRMVGFDTLSKHKALAEDAQKLKESNIYITRVKEAKKKSFKKHQDFFDLELEKNHLFLHSLGIVSWNCCRLRLDNKELIMRGGGLFGSNPLTGSIGVCTINLPRIGYLSKTKKEFFKRLKDLMDLAKESLEIKRKALDDFAEKGLYPYSKVYLAPVKKIRGSYFGNHFSTIGLLGMNETLSNFLGEDMGTSKGRKFALEVLEFMRNRLIDYQKETGSLYNLEATPAEGASYRQAKADKEKYPDIITAGTKEKPYYTNSSQLPVGYTDDIFEALKLQDEAQCKYTGGCVEKGNKVLTDKGLLPIENIVNNFRRLKPIKALSYNSEKKGSEWDEVVKAVKVDVKREDKIRVKGERGLDITTSDWHPFFVLEKFKPNPACPICGEKVKNINAFASHIRFNPECGEKYKGFPKYKVVEKRADDLKKGDYILQNSNNLYPEKKGSLTNDLMWLTGFFIGDGCISKHIDNRGGNKLTKYKIRFNSENKKALEKAAGILSENFGAKAKVIKNDKRSEPPRELVASRKNVIDFFFGYGFKEGKKAYNISIPWRVKENINRENVNALLSGLMDSDGHVDKAQGDFEYYTVSSKLADDFLEVFSLAGIMVSKAKKKTRRENEVDIYRLRIPCYQLTKLSGRLEITGNAARIKKAISAREKRHLPVVRVKTVSKAKVKDDYFYDLMTEKNHNYLAGKNSLVFVHNTVLHGFLGEKINDPDIAKALVKKISTNFHLPYFTLTPTFSICPVHGYISGEHFYCPKCAIKQPCEVYSRIVGYLRPVQQWNVGKKQEFGERKEFKIKKTSKKKAKKKSQQKALA